MVKNGFTGERKKRRKSKMEREREVSIGSKIIFC
jgi:hypothetical protein